MAAKAQWNPAEPFWWLTKDGDDIARKLFDRHYSRQRYRDGRTPKLFCGPGSKIVLRSWEADALFVWRKFKDDCLDPRTGKPQEGVNCAVFRNETPFRSSVLIGQADAIADYVWPGERHYTYVKADAVRSTNPGCCFKMAGWRPCGRTKGGLMILERAGRSVAKPADAGSSDRAGAAELGRESPSVSTQQPANL